MRIWIAILGTMSIFCGIGCTQKTHRTPAATLAASKKEIRSSGSQEQRGGATSGGGDEVGIEVSRVISLVNEMVQNEPGQIYSEKMKAAINKMATRPKIFIDDMELPARAGDREQNGVAFSVYDGKQATIRIQRQRWEALMNPVKKDVIIHHELAVLAGIERTGDYVVSTKFEAKQSLFWEKARSKKFLCSISLFEKKPDFTELVDEPAMNIGEAVGSVAFHINFVGAKGGMGVIHQLTPPDKKGESRALFARWVISSSGYLRASLAEATLIYGEWGNVITWKSLTNETPEKVYYTPYESLEVTGGRFGVWGKYYTLVSCTKL